MPTYSFRCRSCDASIERQLSLSDYAKNPAQPCPTCQAAMARVYTPVSIGGAASPSASPSAPSPRGGCRHGSGCC